MPYQQGGNISFGRAPFTGQEEEQDPFALSPYLAGTAPRPGQTPGISDYFSGATPPINGRPPVEEMPPSEDMSPPPGDPLMDELDKAKDWKSGAALGLGAALGGMFGGSGAADAAGASAATTQNHMLEAIQQSRALQAKDRENRFRLSEEKIQGAEKMMSDLHGVDMANMPDHVKQEMTRLTQLYNQKLQGGLTEKEATEVLAMGARMQQLLQEAKADPAYSAGMAKSAGEAQAAGEFARRQKGWDLAGGRPDDAPTWMDADTYSKYKQQMDLAKQKAASVRASIISSLGGRADEKRIAAAEAKAMGVIKLMYSVGEIENFTPEIWPVYKQLIKDELGVGDDVRKGLSASGSTGAGLPGVEAPEDAAPLAKTGADTTTTDPQTPDDVRKTSGGQQYRFTTPNQRR